MGVQVSGEATVDAYVPLLGGKQHGSLARAGKVRSVPALPSLWGRDCPIRGRDFHLALPTCRSSAGSSTARSLAPERFAPSPLFYLYGVATVLLGDRDCPMRGSRLFY